MLAKNLLCVDCVFKNLPFYQNSDSNDCYSNGPQSNFSSNDKRKFFLTITL